MVLRYYQRLKLADVAAALDVSQATAKRIIARALDKLRAKLGFLPMGATLSQAMTAAVESSRAPGATLRAGRAVPATSTTERVIAGAAVAAAVTLAFVGFAAVSPGSKPSFRKNPFPPPSPKRKLREIPTLEGLSCWKPPLRGPRPPCASVTPRAWPLQCASARKAPSSSPKRQRRPRRESTLLGPPNAPDPLKVQNQPGTPGHPISLTAPAMPTLPTQPPMRRILRLTPSANGASACPPAPTNCVPPTSWATPRLAP